MKKVVLASNNAGKLREIRAILAPFKIEVVSQSDFEVTAVEETGETFADNAILKARAAAAASGIPAIADDSGLEVDALGGEPGIYSARYAKAGATDQANNEKLLRKLGHALPEERTARFRCAAVMVRDETDPSPVSAEGVWEGMIASMPRGNNGFGYDPVFIPADHNRTSAELTPEEKDKQSHRGKAFRALADAIASTESHTEKDPLDMT